MNYIQRQPVQSSSLKSVGYDAATQTLEVEFHSGGVYHYFQVPPEVYEALMRADSLGRYFLQHIRGGYRYRRVG